MPAKEAVHGQPHINVDRGTLALAEKVRKMVENAKGVPVNRKDAIRIALEEWVAAKAGGKS